MTSVKKVLSKKIKELGLKKYTTSPKKFKGGASSFINVDNKKDNIVLMIKYFEKGDNFSLSTYNTDNKKSKYINEFNKQGESIDRFESAIDKILSGKPAKMKVDIDY